MATCKSELHIADDFGDNRATMHCQLEEEHDGKHREEFRFQEGESGAHCCVLEWEGDDREE